jgi:hypothetical protein
MILIFLLFNVKEAPSIAALISVGSEIGVLGLNKLSWQPDAGIGVGQSTAENLRAAMFIMK